MSGSSHPIPPPPAGYFGPDPADAERPRARIAARPKGLNFVAEIDVAEVDERGRPGSTFAARARELSRSSLVFSSRRMGFVGRLVIVAVHRIDDRPAPLFGKIVACDYDTDGLYRIDIDLLPTPEGRDIKVWLDRVAQARA